ncbi:hypothetical protein GE21DRAFT_8750 [Neurospora crassa]|uniref:Uncharacterized protein n=1 Tax=Neurospora crassa (strain ATCC 24698 / 74-OR23-1A / CBS 708.71 / DSM 1257 / FGSC 987) TaxID=367110 RepID=V5ILC2_NEUCR|nr:hypothetical protein NCU12084 [Neurospora crassa OR74A]ESA42135.1 hypothetical protein NCU12084 [Neurospora crassa OR74A]KHE88974.1 hypothetical protein GE21DRAFT_8750 [Neurospora crassa]|eukprot:XP_011395040.1 hypothetical protein NCU12084 [Neurospora crassa OR74A]
MPITTPTILGLPTSHLPLLLHLLIETPASLSFLLRPESQLPLLSSSSSASSSSPSSPSPSLSPSSTSPSPSSTTSTSSSSSSSSTALSSPRSSSIITPQQATEARLILRNFGGLLLSVNCLVFYLLFLFPHHHRRFSSTGLRPENEKEGEELIRGITGCLSLYHVFPLYRAWKRICMSSSSSSSRAAVDENIKKRKKDLRGEEGKEDETQKTLGGPVVHFVVHMIVGGLMGAAGLGLL